MATFSRKTKVQKKGHRKVSAKKKAVEVSEPPTSTQQVEMKEELKPASEHQSQETAGGAGEAEAKMEQTMDKQVEAGAEGATKPAEPMLVAEEVKETPVAAETPAATPPPTMGVGMQVEKQSRGGGGKVVWIILILVVLGGLIGGGIYMYKKALPTEEEVMMMEPVAPVEEEMMEPVATVAPTMAEVDLEMYEVTILNGSGIPGEAGRAQSLLEEAGFSVGHVGNAETFDFEDTVISYQPDTDMNFVKKLEAELESKYIVVTEEVEELESEVVVTVGSGKVE